MSRARIGLVGTAVVAVQRYSANYATASVGRGCFGQVIDVLPPRPDQIAMDPDLHQPTVGARIFATSGYTSRETLTDNEGRFSFVGLPRGVYQLRIEAYPERTFDRSVYSVRIKERQPEEIDLTECSAFVSYRYVDDWLEKIKEYAEEAFGPVKPGSQPQ